jgi:hypothetical protein
MSWQYISFGVPDALATVNAEMFAEARQQAAAQVKQAAEHIEALMRSKALELVGHLRDRLQIGPDGKKIRLFPALSARWTTRKTFCPFFV